MKKIIALLEALLRLALVISLGFGYTLPAAAAPLPATNAAAALLPQAAALAMTNTDTLLIDVDGDSQADPGDTLRYTVVLSNTGDSDALGAVFSDTLDANLTYVAGSLEATPLAFDQALATLEDTALPLTLTAYDPDGDALALSVTVGPLHGSLSGTSPNLTYTPNADYNGPDSFTFQACDAACDMAQVTIAVTAVNDAPSFSAGPDVTVLEDSGAYSGAWATAISPGPANEAGQGLAFNIVANTNPALFSSGPAVAADGALSFTPAANANGSATLTLALQDDGGTANGGQDTSAQQSFTITLTAVNDAPSFVAGSDVNVTEDSGPYSSSGWATAISAGPADEAGQTLAFQVTGNTDPALFSSGPAVAPNGTLSFTPEVNASGVATITLALQDDGGTANGGQDTSPGQTFHITIDAVNDVPVVSAATFAIDENSANGTAVGTVTATDPDAGQSLAFAITAGNTGSAFAIDAATGQIAVANTAALNYESTPAFNLTVQATDDGAPALSGSATIVINLNDVNEAPTANGATFSLAENSANGTAVGTVSATDPDAGQNLAFAITAGNTGGAFAIDAASGQITVANVAAVNFEASPAFTLTVRATDNGTPTLFDTATVLVNLTDVNETPTANPATFSIDENSANGTAVGTVAASDPDAGQSLAFAITGGNTGGAFAINASSGQITVANGSLLDFDVTPVYNLTVQVTDNGTPALSDTAAVTINLNDVNESPTVNPATFSLDENSANGTAVGTVTASDPDASQTLAFAITAGNTGGAFAIDAASGQITVANASAVDYESSPSFSLTVQATDNGTPALSDTATVTVNLNDLNETPVVTPATLSLTENSANGTVVGMVAATDPDTGQTLAFAITAGNTGGAFAIDAASGQITVANVAAVDYETNPTFNLTVQATDNGTPALSGSATITINLIDSNDAPTVNPATFSLPENSPNGTAVGTVTATNPEGGQTLAFAITAGNTGGAFAIDAASGQITVANVAAVDYETNPAFSLTVRATDDGSPVMWDEATITVNLTDVNEAPVANDVAFAIDENSANGTVVGTVTATDPDAGQTLAFAITAGNTSGAFAINASTGQISVANVNALNYEVTPIFNLTVQATDNGAPALSDTATITINLNDVDEAPIVTGESYETIGNTLLQVAAADTATGAHVYVSGNLLSNDSDPEGGTLTASIVDATPGSTVTLNATGTFTFLPPPGATTSVNFVYQVSDPGGHTANGTVTITPRGMVWYVRNNAAAGGLGRSSDPFDTLAEADAASTAAVASTIYVFYGTGTSTNQEAGLALDASQRLIGSAVALSVPVSVNGGPNPTPLLAAGSTPLIGRTGGGNAITLGTNNEIRGLNLGGAAGTTAISGASFGTLTLSTVTVNTDGQALSLDTGALAATFDSLTATGGAYGISLLSVTGNLTINTGTLSGATTAAFRTSQGTANITYAGTINSTSRSVDIQNRTGGTIDFSGPVNGSGTGVYLNGNTGSTINFTGGVTLTTGANAAFTATGGGTVSVTGAANTLATTTGTALNVTNTTIGTLGLTFRSIAADGATNGILLNNTGSSGGLTLTGTGTTDGSAGTIQDTSGAAVSLISTNNVSISNLNVTNSNGHGVSGSSVTGFSLINANITGAGDAASEHGLYIQNLWGSATIQNSDVSASYDRNVWLQNTSGTLASLAVSGNTFDGITTTGNQSFFLDLPPLSTATVTAASFQNNTFNNNYSKALFVGAQGSSRIDSLRIENNTFSANYMSVDLAAFDTAQVRFVVTGNTMGYSGYAYPGGAGNQVNLYASTNGVLDGRVNTNNITNDPNGGGSAISALLEGNGAMRLEINGNTVSDWSVNGIEVSSRGGTGRVDATITNNTVQGSTSTGPAYNFYLRAGNAASAGNILCFNLAGNTANPSGSGFEIAHYGVDRYVLNPSNHTVYVQGLVPSPGTESNVSTLIGNNNLPVGALLDVVAGTYYNATCDQPTIAAVMGTPTVADAGYGRGRGLARLLSPLQAAARAVAAPQAGETLQLNIATLPAGKKVTVTFDAVVNDPLPQGTTQVSNQALLSGSNFASIWSDDPDTPAAGDPTVTAVYRPVFAPLAHPDGYTTDEDTPLQVAAPGVLENDTDANNDVLTAAIDAPPVRGSLSLQPDGSFTYTPAADDNGVVTFLYHANDGVTNSTPATVTVTVAAVNDAPVLDNGTDLWLDAVNGGDTDPPGMLVSDLLASGGGDPIADVDANALEGIAVTAVDQAHGTWQYNTGSGWLDFADPSDSAARLLAADAATRVRFIPAPAWSGTVAAGMTFRAWDQTSGAAAGVADTTANGGTTAFSVDRETVSVAVGELSDVRVEKAAPAGPVLLGQSVGYTVTVANDGPSPATGLQLVDTLPAGMVFVGASGACGHAAGTVTCDVSTLPAGASATFHITATANITGTLSNTAAVSADQLDPDPANNQATAVLAVVDSLEIYFEDFESPIGGEWCIDRLSTTPSGRRFLGELSNETACLTLDNLPAYAPYVTVSLDFYAIRSVDGDRVEKLPGMPFLREFPDYIVGPDVWQFTADGSTLLHTTFSNWPDATQAYPGNLPSAGHPAWTGAAEIDSLGYVWGTSVKDAVYHLTFTFAHTGSTLQLDFSALGLQDIADESWGIDNVRITVSGRSAAYRVFLPVMIR
ncbi:MAG: cadherin domain-containing protein [Chloroflexota bacterium]